MICFILIKTSRDFIIERRTVRVRELTWQLPRKPAHTQWDLHSL